MQWFYDGQVRRYITQTIRALSNFVVKYGDGTLVRVPVVYGDADRQVASILRQNSENMVNSTPRISVYVGGLAMDRDRLADQTFVDKVNIRERDIVGGEYTRAQGKNYTVERLMPTPFKLTLKCDVWTANTDQKLQLLEQMLVLFNPSLELQTTDNYIDWTSLTVLNLNDITWDSRQVPVGTDTPIDIATLTLDTPIWINPPVKVKHLGVITKVIANVHGTSTTSGTYIDGLSQYNDPMAATTSMADLISISISTAKDYKVEIHGSNAVLLEAHESSVPLEPTLDMPVRQGNVVDWSALFDQYSGKYVAGSSRIYLTQPGGSQIVGTFAINPMDPSVLTVSWNLDTLNSNTGIDSNGHLDSDIQHYAPSGYRNGQPGSYGSPGTFDAIVNPQNFDPKRPTKLETEDQPVAQGKRYLIVDDVGSEQNAEGFGAKAWQGLNGADLIANANDIIEWDGEQWNVIFNSAQESTTMVWQTNTYTNIQYLWNGVSWTKSYEGVYGANQWSIIL